MISLCMILFTLPSPVAGGVSQGQEPDAQEGFCGHHTVHNESCGYSVGTKGSPCTHEHTKECYPEESGNIATPSQMNKAEPTACSHEHDGECGYVPAKAGNPCTYECEICGDKGEEKATPSDAEPKKCICKNRCRADCVNTGCPVCSAKGVSPEDVCEGEETALLGVQTGNSAGWIYNRQNQTLTMNTGEGNVITLQNVSCDGNKLTIGGNDNISGDLDLTGEITEEGVSAEYTITAIEDYAFQRCDSLETVKLPDGVESIGESVFRICPSLIQIAIADENENYAAEDGVLFDKNKTKLICYPAGKDSQDYTVPETVSSIETYAFSYCSALETIKLPESLKSIGWSAFYYSTSLKMIELPEGIEKIEGQTFSYCTGLETVKLPAGIKSIESGAFNYCKSLKTITLLSKEPPTMGNTNPLQGCDSLEQIIVPAESSAKYKSAWGSLISSDQIIGVPYGNLSLEFTPDHLRVPEGESGSVTATIKNTGNEPLYDLEAAVADSMGTVSVFDTTLQEGEETTLTVETNPALAAGTYQIRVQIDGNLENPVSAGFMLEVLNEHTITAETDEHGSAEASPKTAIKGTLVTLTAAPEAGYVFDRWEVVSGGAVIEGNTFTMPDEDVTVRAVFKEKEVLHTVTAETDEHGSAEASPKTAIKGTLVTLTAAPEAGYVFDRWEVVSGGAVIEGNTFTMPDEDVTVRAVFKKADTGSSQSSSEESTSVSYGTAEHPYITGVHGKWASEASAFPDSPDAAPAVWRFVLNNGSTVGSRWAYMDNPYRSEGQPEYEWFLFDETGVMVTGWYYDSVEDCWYYLHDTSDGRLGAMETGWFTAPDGNRYYFDPATGKMTAGYRDIDGRNYYFREDRSTAESAKIYGALLPDENVTDS